MKKLVKKLPKRRKYIRISILCNVMCPRYNFKRTAKFLNEIKVAHFNFKIFLDSKDSKSYNHIII